MQNKFIKIKVFVFMYFTSKSIQECINKSLQKLNKQNGDA